MRPAILGLFAFAACTVQRGPQPEPDADPQHPPGPRDDLVPAIGSPETLEIATWNIENFPDTAGTPSLVADLITSLNLDIVVTEEIASETAWQELLDRLPEHDGVLSEHRYTPTEYQKIGVIYRSSEVTVGTPTLLFVDDGFSFPRPPFALPVTVNGKSFEVIGVHLKAGVSIDDEDRRRAAIVALEQHLRAQIDGGGEKNVVLLGDYNQQIVDPEGRAVLAPLLDAPDLYTVRTEPAATAGGISFLNFGGTFIDHITTTAALAEQWPGAHVEVQRIDQEIGSYENLVSDHLPVVLVAPR